MNRPRSQLPAWQALQAHAIQLAPCHLRQLFADDPQRGQRFSAEACGWYLNYAKNRITATTLTLLLQLADACQLRPRIQAMFAGEAVNVTEQRAALHTALRLPAGVALWRDGQDIAAQVHAVLAQMAAFTGQVVEGRWRGYSGLPIRHVLNIGIGGSDLGPEMVYQALRHYRHSRLDCRFVSNLDPCDFRAATDGLNPAETLVIVCSKTFKTQETLVNAQRARAWIVAGLGDERAVARHCVAVSANRAAAQGFGIDCVFGLWDWDGGRYSLDSAIGLSTMLAIGPAQFHAMLAGFHAMDQHFLHAPLADNLPVLMGLLAVWYSSFLAAPSVAILPYAHDLKRFPAYLQQLTMESNGKSVTLAGRPVDYPTGPVYWGEPGTNGQHAFYQLLHQGGQLIPCDLIGFCHGLTADTGQHQLLVAHLLAQGQALAFGNTLAEQRADGVPDWLLPHRRFAGNHPSNTLLAERLTPASLGSLVALYEHSVFTQACLWQINPFDQWGVELGKTLAGQMQAELASASASDRLDSATLALIDRYRRLPIG